MKVTVPHRGALARARAQGGVISRAQLRKLGVSRFDVRTEVRASRWVVHGRHTVAVHTTALSVAAERWRAVWESGGTAALDGSTAPIAAGLTGFDENHLHVSVLSGHHSHVVPGVVRHHVGARLEDEIARGAPRHVVPAIACLRAAQWAVSGRQAALLLVMPVQQKLITGPELLKAADAVPVRRRPALIRSLVKDIATGVEALGELDFAHACRRRGLPEPDRQVVREGPEGRIYLDVRWDDINLVVEIDGIHHQLGIAPVKDALRQNVVTLSGDRVLRIPVLGLRLEEDAFMDQVEAAHHHFS